MLEVLLCIFTLIVCILPFYCTHFSRVARVTSNIPGPAPLPLIGNIRDFGKNPVELLKGMIKVWEQYGDVFKIWLGPSVFFMTANPEHLEVFLTNTTNITKNNTYQFLHKWLGTGLLTSTGHKWKKHRKLLTPTFHFKILQQFVDIFNNNNKILLRKLEKHTNGLAFNIYDYITLAALDIICETSLGVSINAQTDSESDYVVAVKGMANIVMKRSFTPWMHSELLFNWSSEGKKQEKYLAILHNTTRNIIKTRRQEYTKTNESLSPRDDLNGEKQRLALLDMLLESSINEGIVTDEEIREEVDTFMFEGHDTSASATTFCLWLLGTHQSIQHKAYEEQKEIFGDSQQETTFDDLQNMKYLENVIKETLRLYPSVPMYGRELIEDIKIDKYFLPAGTNVGFMPFFLHRNPNIYPEPEKFDPDRFEISHVKDRHPFSYLPFSAGPRNCIGQKFAMLEIKSTISGIIRNYKVTVEDQEDLVLSLEIVLRCQDGVYLKIQKR